MDLLRRDVLLLFNLAPLSQVKDGLNYWVSPGEGNKIEGVESVSEVERESSAMKTIFYGILNLSV